MDERLLNAVNSHNVVFIVGTGVSAASSDSDPVATWEGLISSGIDRAKLLGSNDDWVALVRNTLDHGFNNDKLDVVLSAAGMVASELSAGDGYAYTKWLSDTVGSLRMRHRELATALTDLPWPILTTNYDTLLETSTRGSAVWTNTSAMQGVLAGTTNAVGHLHGIWSDPESIVLTQADYEKLISSKVAQTLQSAASTVKSLVYVGFGAGLADPNFSRLITWHKNSFIPSNVDHFRLCRASELEAITGEHGADHIRPVVYGDSYGDLAPFIRSMNPSRETVSLSSAGIARDVVAELQQSFGEDMVRDAIIGETLDDPMSRPFHEVVFPPVLLPVPQADFIRSRTATEPGAKIERLIAEEEVRHADVIVLAAAESSGLSTAVRWMALTAANYLGGAAPLYVQFQKCRKVDKPLREQVRNEAVSRGLIEHKTTTLPPFVLALDDFSPFVDRISDRVIEDLRTSEAVFTVIGCAHGAEEDVLERLSQAGIKAKVRYIGKLAASDVRGFARLASPSTHVKLADQVLAMLQKENLPRTPFTVSLLISVIIRGGMLSNNASQTSILDDYVGLLLGRGDPHDDARFGLDQTQREAILSGLAEAFVLEGTGGLEEADVIKIFQAIFDKFGWQESPGEVLTSFLDRKVLRRDGRYIAFFRSSFLHLFAAKRAISDREFRAYLLDRPLFFGTAVGDYAALNRNDEDLLSQISGLLGEGRWNAPRGGVFDEVGLAQPRALTETPEQVRAAHEASGGSEIRRADDAFDESSDDDRPPFPTTDEQDVPAGIQLVRTLQLVSTVLRDSDQIENLDLKAIVLVKVLTHWGFAMSLLNQDRSFRDFLRSLLENAEVFENQSLKEKEETLDELAKAIPAAVTLGGIGFSLASRKLIVILNRALADGSAKVDDETSVSAAFFIFALRESTWPTQLAELLASKGNIWIVRNFLLHSFLRAYYNDDVEPGVQENVLLHMCVDVVQKSTSYKDAAAEKDHREQLIQSFKNNRLLRRSHKLSLGPQGPEGS